MTYFAPKTADPRYVAGVSANDDDMTDEEWAWAMGSPTAADFASRADLDARVATIVARLDDIPERPSVEEAAEYDTLMAQVRDLLA